MRFFIIILLLLILTSRATPQFDTSKVASKNIVIQGFVTYNRNWRTDHFFGVPDFSDYDYSPHNPLDSVAVKICIHYKAKYLIFETVSNGDGHFSVTIPDSIFPSRIKISFQRHYYYSITKRPIITHDQNFNVKMKIRLFLIHRRRFKKNMFPSI
jgi:hypothetical protein